MSRLAYVASPYSHRDPGVMQWRTNQAAAFSTWLIKRGLCYPLSPIQKWGPYAEVLSLPTDASSWTACNRAYFDACAMMYLLKLDGWRESVGVEMELHWARDRRLTIIGASVADGGYDLEVVG